MDGEKRIYRNINDLIESEPQVISMGFKPSGTMHLGSWASLFQAMYSLSKIPGSQLDLEIMDLDYDFQRGTVADSYLTKVIQHPETGSMILASDYLKEQFVFALETAQEILGEELSERVKISRFSDVLRDPEMIKKFIAPFQDGDASRNVLNALFDSRWQKYDLPLFPICPSCGKSNSNFAHRTEQNTLRTKCENLSCEVKEFEVRLDRAGAYNIFYLVDPIRDAISTTHHPRVDAHIFGGDYGLEYGVKKITKAERVYNMMERLGLTPPSIYVGPEITIGGLKMAKSNSFGITYRELPDLGGFSKWFIEQVTREAPPTEIDFLKSPYGHDYIRRE